jgi:hypothetical protein
MLSMESPYILVSEKNFCKITGREFWAFATYLILLSTQERDFLWIVQEPSDRQLSKQICNFYLILSAIL